MVQGGFGGSHCGRKGAPSTSRSRPCRESPERWPRREAREFGNPSQALSLLHRLGLAAGAFDLRGWNPALKAGSRSRPDRAEALRRTHEAASHDAWFRAQVEEALREADDPHTAWMSHEEVTADMATQRARIMEMMAGKPGKGR